MAKKSQAEILGGVLRKRRDECGLSQEALAEQAGLDPTFISRIENGHRRPSVESVWKVAKALDVSFEELMADVGRAFRRARY